MVGWGGESPTTIYCDYYYYYCCYYYYYYSSASSYYYHYTTTTTTTTTTYCCYSTCCTYYFQVLRVAQVYPTGFRHKALVCSSQPALGAQGLGSVFE